MFIIMIILQEQASAFLTANQPNTAVKQDLERFLAWQATQRAAGNTDCVDKLFTRLAAAQSSRGCDTLLVLDFHSETQPSKRIRSAIEEWSLAKSI